MNSGMGHKLAADLPRDAEGRLLLYSYARMSDGFEGKEINVESQFEVNRTVAASRNATIVKELSDPLSAWKPSVRRPEWEELVEGLRTRKAAGAIIYHIDRFLRQSFQLEELLRTLEDMGCVLYSGGSERRLDSTDDQFILRIEVAQACKASADTQRRILMKQEALRGRGVLIGGGKRPFAWPGLEPAKAGKKRVAVSEAVVEEEMEALRWAFKHIAKGGTLAEIVRTWNQAELYGPLGNEWTTVTARQVMQRQRHAGRIEHKGEVVNLIADHEPTIDPELFDQVQAIFAGRKRGRPNVTSLCSGLIYCTCGNTMVSRPRYVKAGPVATYRCMKPKGCGGRDIDQVFVDDFMKKFVINRLADPAVAERVSSYASEAGKQIKALREQLATVKGHLDDLDEKMAAGTLSYERWEKLQAGMAKRQVAIEGELGAAEAAAADLDAMEARTRADVEKEWLQYVEDGDMESLRTMVKAATQLYRIQIEPGRTADGRRVPGVERISTLPL